MLTDDFIIDLFCRVDDLMRDQPKHTQAKLFPSEIVTLALLYTIKGGSGRAFYRWLIHDKSHLFVKLPERTRLFRLFATHQDWHRRFLAAPTFFGVADTYGIELIHPVREGRSKQQIGRKGKSNKRWIVGAKFYVLLNQCGQVVDWDCNSANVADNSFTKRIEPYADEMIVLADQGFHRAPPLGDPANLKVCGHKQWSERMLVERSFGQITTVWHGKKMSQRKWPYLKARLGFTTATFNLLGNWDGQAAPGVQPAIARFSL